MKKEVLFVILFAFAFLLIFPSVNAALNETSEQKLVDKAYICLESKTNTTTACLSLTTEAKAFAVLANGQCKTQLIADAANNGQCWPSSGCKIKTTAQSILALENSGTDTTTAQNWLLNQSRGTTDLLWFLEIESPTATSCTIDYSTGTFNIEIGADKKITGDAGSCLTVTSDGYWLGVDSSCFNEEFEVSCDKGFLTTLLFKKPSSSTVHVSQEASSASSGGKTIEKVESFCFVENNVCNYEGSLWAALVLDSQDQDIDKFLPYLVTMAEDNRALIPDSFLYFLTSETQYRTSLLAKQKVKKWWFESNDKFYDTSLALLPFQQESLQEKTNSKEWLLSVQDANGCWENNVRNTAFILSSVWPNSFIGGSSSGGGSSDFLDCEEEGNYCTSSVDCEQSGGDVLSEFECSGVYRCCSVSPKVETCSELGGVICSSSQYCQGGAELSSGDLSYGQTCCVDGSCKTQSSDSGSDSADTNECELELGTCRSLGCNADEQETDLFSCGYSGDSCCLPKSEEKGSLLWVWILLFLIVLAVFAIIFREKLRMLWFKMTSGRKSGSSSSGPTSRPGPGGPSHPFSPMPMFQQKPFQLTTLPPPGSQRPAVTRTVQPRTVSRPRPKSGAQSELDEVLKKLKDMSK